MCIYVHIFNLINYIIIITTTTTIAGRSAIAEFVCTHFKNFTYWNSLFNERL